MRTSIKPSAADKRRRIEAAALALFTTQGFHGTSTREIAIRAGVSTAAIYAYFPSKEALFGALVERHRAAFVKWFRMAVGSSRDPLTPRSLRALASTIRATMKDDPEYFLLVLVDVIEFKNRHYHASFSNTPQWFRLALGPALEKVRERPGWCGQDPAFVLAVVYRYFVHFGWIEQHMGGRRYLGVSSDLAIRRVVDLLAAGLWRSSPGAKAPARVPPQLKLPEDAVQNRMYLLRLLSGRLWSDPASARAGRARNEDGSQTADAPLLFLPRIDGHRADDTQLTIEAAALELFTTQGFHGTNIREIAEKAGISQGAIYTYFSSKERIFEELVATYGRCMTTLLRRVLQMLDDPFSPDGLRLLAHAIRSMIYDDAQHWLLMFVDVVEFKSAHFADMYGDLPRRIRSMAGPMLLETRRQPGWCGLDPAFALAAIFLLFFNYFIVERHMHGSHHLGVSEEEAIEALISLVSFGFWHEADSPGRQAIPSAAQ